MTSTSPRTEQVLSTLRLHRGDWQKRFHVVDIGVFGSVARGDARPDSDVDVWVRLDPLTPYALVHLKQELETLLSTSVDVVRLRERMNPSLKQRILDEGLRRMSEGPGPLLDDLLAALERASSKSQPLLQDPSQVESEQGRGSA